MTLGVIVFVRKVLSDRDHTRKVLGDSQYHPIPSNTNKYQQIRSCFFKDCESKLKIYKIRVLISFPNFAMKWPAPSTKCFAGKSMW